MTEQTITGPDALLNAVVDTDVDIVELGHPHTTGMPCSPNHPGFRMTLIRRHGDMVRPDGGSASNEIIVTGGHVGTHVDALSHVSHEGKLHGGIDAQEAQRGGKFSQLGAESIPFMLRRGLLLDVARVRGVDSLDVGQAVTEQDLRDAADAAGVTPRRGDVVLIRTGWARYFDDPQRYLGQQDGVPGADVGAGRWLAASGIAAAGADTTAFEHIPAGKGHSVLPVHRVMLVENGIHIIEHLDLEDTSARGLTEFTFVMAPLRITGGTGSPVRPVAVVAS
ncbi:cyclase family protein [Rhodococcus pyridinivorans]|uniref:Putative metal-dependent hydrolase n=1 Tax=Rhodococcus pyridinivorans AK37 TaxID=1114960 RepID=H0JR70_9NOCA|nr:cyclase family protein [Rhodococcus pyridinivorans]EHK83853.1 putative metal-dependent hydrolase [Rhodococcus pyridinivorans AK37]MCD2140330.1 cyclase family protein [Rhodococcus pyridinivorans]